MVEGWGLEAGLAGTLDLLWLGEKTPGLRVVPARCKGALRQTQSDIGGAVTEDVADILLGGLGKGENM